MDESKLRAKEARKKERERIKEQKKKKKQEKKENLARFKFWGLPITSLILFAALIFLAVAIYTLLASLITYFITGIIPSASGALVVFIVIMPCIFAFAFSYFFVVPVIVFPLKLIYRQARTIWFDIFGFIIFNLNFLMSFALSSKIFGWNIGFLEDGFVLFFEKLIEFEGTIGFGLISSLGFTGAPSSVGDSFMFLHAGMSTLVFFVFAAMEFHWEACYRCGRANVNNWSIEEGKSYTRAEFEKTSGYWTEKNATVTSSQYGSANVKYDTYVPGKLEFKGVYKYTDNTETNTCPICGHEKWRFWTSSSRIM